MGTKQLRSLVISLGLLLPTAASAQWALNGNPVCTATGAQDGIDIAGNGLGGAVMVWQDGRVAFGDIYARQVEQFGAVEWTSNGIPLCTAANGQLDPSVVHDGFGYLLYTWEDYRNGNADIYGAITDRLGNIFTPGDGFVISTGAGSQQHPVLTSNEALGVGYVAWTDTRNGNNDIYAQAFNVGNYDFWTTGGLAFCTNASDQNGPAIAPDGGDGAIVVWQDFRNGNYDIYAQRAGLGNNLMWAADGVAVCTQASAQLSPMIVSDGVGGAIIVWLDHRHGTFQNALYAQRINSAGVPQWTATGVAVAVSTDLIILPQIVQDGNGGAIVVWQDERNIATTGSDIYAQHISSAGVTNWAVNGAVMCSAPFAQSSVSIAPDGFGGVIAAWQDFRSLGPTDVYTQRMDGFGTPMWTANGALVCAATGNQFNVQVAQSGFSAIMAWEDRRTFGTTDTDVYTQRIETGTSLYGYPLPYITSIVDVPNDEGGFVRITFRAGDGQVSGEFEVYNLHYHGGDVVYVAPLTGSSSYTFDVLNTGVGIPNTYYLTTYTDYGLTSNFVAGTSLDNLAPPAPTLAGARNGADVDLSWNVTAPDIDHYVIQRSDLGDFVVTGTSYTDVGVPLMELNYRMHAVDIHGNSSNNSNQVTISTPTGIGDTPMAPKVLTLLPNSPNPFSASTSLRVGVPKASTVRVEVFDVAGRRVAVREAGQLSAGWRDVVFDGRDDRGQALASGVYFYRVSAGGETHTRKMVISR